METDDEFVALVEATESPVAKLLAAKDAEILLLRAGISDCLRMLRSEANTKAALFRAEDMLHQMLMPNAALTGKPRDEL